MKITIIAFNVGLAGRYVNGPGMSLYNFLKYIKRDLPECYVEVYSERPYKTFDRSIKVRPLSDRASLNKSIHNSNILHHWSGLSRSYSNAVRFANKNKKTVIIGPNVIDCVDEDNERRFLSSIDFNLILSVNDRLKYLISKIHNISIQKIKTFIVGPDIELWKPSGKFEYDILWKGNSSHFVKDINFALEVEKKMGKKYNFKFIGYPTPYDYFSHIDEAKLSRLYFSTSLSETKGMSLMEQWSAGIPSVTHSKIYMHGLNYKTGIITNRDVESYCDAIDEIMENKDLYNALSKGCRQYMVDNFSSDIISNKYQDILRGANVG